MTNGENQDSPKTSTPQKPGIRTMVSDIKEYAKTKKFSLADLVRIRQNKEIIEPRAPIFSYILFGLILMALIAVGIFGLNRLFEGPDQESKIAAPVSLIPAGQERVIKLKTADKKTFLNSWRPLFSVQLLPGQFLYVKTLAQEPNRFFNAQDLFNLLEVKLPPLLENSLDDRSTLGIIDTAGGNEAVLILEIRTYASAFAGLLEWEENLPVDLLSLLRPDSSYERGENVFLDSVVANNDARFLKNKSGGPIIGYSIFNQRFLIMVQSPQALEIIIKQMSLFPPQ